MLKVRVISALILLPLVLFAFIYGAAWFVILFLMLCMTLSIFEASTMLINAFERKLGPPGHVPGDLHNAAGRIPTGRLVFPAITTALGWGMLLLSTNSRPEASIGVIAIFSLAALLIGCFSTRNIDLAAARAFGLLVSLIYGSLPWIVVWHTYLLGENSRYVLLIMTVTWCGDTGAYFGGRYYGGKLFSKKLAPSISPNKTWEGSLAGLASSIVGAIVLNLLFLNNLGPMTLIVVAAFCGGISAQVGDLLESMLKRFAGVKDSGTIIPGHGGFLDRVDGILFAAPVIWAILYYFKP